MKLRFLLLTWLLPLFPACLFSNTLYFPQVAFGGGYSTTFSIVNTGTTAVSGRLNLYTQGGSLRADLGGPINLEPGNSTSLTIPDVGPLTAVWGEFDAGNGTVQGVATFDSRDISGRLVTSAGVLGIEADNSFLIPVDVTSTTASTGFAVANISNSDLSIEFRLFTENGAMVASNLSFPIRAHTQIADFVPNIITEIHGIDSFRGTLVIRSLAFTPSLAATALSVKEGLLSASPVATGAAGGASTLEFPQVVFGGGYSTTLTIMNAGAGVLLANLRCFMQSGVERTDLATTISAVGNGSTRSTLPNVGPLTIVWCELSATTGTFRGVATFNLRDANQVLVTTAGVVGIQPGNSFSVPVDITPTGGTGIAVANLKDTSLGVTLRLLDANGSLVAIAADPRFTGFPPRGQFADFVTNIFPQLGGTTFRGALVIDAGAGASAGSLATTALTVKEGVLSALPVIPGTL